MPDQTALIVVDVQEDFLPGGALGVEDGHRATPLIWVLMKEVDVIVFTRDWHPPDHCSFVEPGLNPEYKDGSWPVHCVQGTEGAEIDEILWDKALEADKPIILVNKSFDHYEEVYSGFGGIVANTWGLSGRGLLGRDLGSALDYLGVRETKIGGLALDYCVKATALDAQKYGFHPTVYLNATRPVAYLSGVDAVAEMAYAGVILVARAI